MVPQKLTVENFWTSMGSRLETVPRMRRRKKHQRRREEEIGLQPVVQTITIPVAEYEQINYIAAA